MYTLVLNYKKIHSNYVTSAMPYIGVIIDGAEDWIKAYNNSNKEKIKVPLFSDKEQAFYEDMRSSIKIWDRSYSEVYQRLEILYQKSEEYFSGKCKPIAKFLKLYDIYGADIVDRVYCGNTILCSDFVPQFSYGSEVGPQIEQLSAIGGKYISLFRAKDPYEINRAMVFSCTDYGGFEKSPVGNAFSDRFVLFSILCQINFVLKCIDGFLLNATTTKLRFSYLMYYYVMRLLPEINQKLSTNFQMDNKWVCDKFRNAMAHYKIGVSLQESEIITTDSFYGLTQKYYNSDFTTVKDSIIKNLSVLSEQLTVYLNL